MNALNFSNLITDGNRETIVVPVQDSFCDGSIENSLTIDIEQIDYFKTTKNIEEIGSLYDQGLGENIAVMTLIVFKEGSSHLKTFPKGIWVLGLDSQGVIDKLNNNILERQPQKKKQAEWQPFEPKIKPLTNRPMSRFRKGNVLK